MPIDDETYKKDFEDLQIEEDIESESVQFWERKQREVVTTVVDYNLRTLSELVTSSEINLSPAYQRRSRWDDVRKSRLIESFLMNVPVPPIFLNEDKYGEYSVIDGKQRLIAINEFLRGRLILSGLRIFPDINGKSYDDLPPRLQTVIRTRPTLRAIIILRQSDEDIKFEVFRRLNTGGVSLNPQEIRNSAYPGPLNDFILNISEIKKFHDLLGIKNKEKSSIYKEMKDAEFVLRYLAFKDNWTDFSGSIRRRMDNYMWENQKMTTDEINEQKRDFLHNLDLVEAAFGAHAFRRWLPEKNQWRQQIVAALYDAEMFACKGLPEDLLKNKQPKIIEEMKQLFNYSDFRKAIDASTNTPASFRIRIKIVREILLQTISQ